ncbi:MAG: phosphoribosyltransferase family protein [Anaerolineae bacterium]|nr:phosphoribosyltransferase family protein [Thermoflexus sp.]MDW8065402.1 phosphoribosyltransferase family protein [Anaerolineae bacterium]
MRFRDRRDAGQRLAEALRDLELEARMGQVVVMGIPRGGVVVAYEIARALQAPLDVILAHKLGAPGNPELAIGAVAEDGTLWVDPLAVAELEVSPEYIEEEVRKQQEELRRQAVIFRGARPAIPVENRSVVVVDDGIATGATMRVSLRSLRNRGARRRIVAVPLAPPEMLPRVESEADMVVVLHTPLLFWAVGTFYEQFDQVSEEEVSALLKEALAWGKI